MSQINLRVNFALDPNDRFEAMCIGFGCATAQDVCDLSDNEWSQLFVRAVNEGAIGGYFDPRTMWNAVDDRVEPLFPVDSI